MNPYTTLGVTPDATQEQIRSAYRSAAQKNHPDKGGDLGEFQQIQAAYELLSDVGRRKRFDETGDTGTQREPTEDERVRAQAMEYLTEIIGEVIDSDVNLRFNSVFSLIEKQVKAMRQKIEQSESALQARVERLSDARSRVKIKEGAGEPVMVMDTLVNGIKSRLEKAKFHHKTLDAIVEIIENHEYEVDEMTPQDRERAEVQARKAAEAQVANALHSFFGRRHS